MKLRFLLPFALMAIALLFVACEIEDDADATDTSGTPDGTVSTCDPECVAPQTCVNGTCQDPVSPGLAYRFVRIDDKSLVNDTPDGGADIDAVLLFKAGTGTPIYAEDVIAYVHGGGTGDALDPTELTGAPDAFYDYPDVTNCDVSSDRFLSLGGEGGYAIIRMGGDIEEGDALDILEVGGCLFDDGEQEAIVEPVEVAISVAQDPLNEYWVTLGEGEGPEVSFVIPNLPVVTD